LIERLTQTSERAHFWSVLDILRILAYVNYVVALNTA